MEEKAAFVRRMSIICAVAMAFCMIGVGFVRAADPTPVKEGVQVAPKPKVQIDTKTATEISYALLAGKVKLTAFQIAKVDTQCDGAWQARIVNTNAVPFQHRSGFSIIVLEYVENLQRWVGTGHAVPGLGVMSPGEERTINGVWNRQPAATRLKIQTQWGTTILSEREVTIPALPAPSIDILGFAIDGDNSVVTLRNNNTVADCNLTVQKFKAKNSVPDTWVPAGGQQFAIAGSSTVDCGSSGDGPDLKANWDKVKVWVYRNDLTSRLIAERIFTIDKGPQSIKPSNIPNKILKRK